MKKTTVFLCAALLAAMCFSVPCRGEEAAADTSAGKDKITVACYYFPNYHLGDPRNVAMEGKGEDWSEWELVKAATPRFEGHHQPNVPLWGYVDEKDPKVMAMKIKAATDHGVDVFIFDWYYFEDGPFLNRCLDEGFLKAENTNDLKFALMWANHDWLEIQPYTVGTPHQLRFPGKVSPEKFDEICNHVIRDYFLKPNYWKIDGKPYFSIYDIQKFAENFGSLEATLAAMQRMDEKAKAAGLPGVHWNLVAWGSPILPVENSPPDVAGLVKALPFDSTTSYVWIHHVGLGELQTDFNHVRDVYFGHWRHAKSHYGVPYYPNASMGWDPSPRTNQATQFGNFGYPYMNTIGNNTPENFKAALQMIRDEMLADPNGPRIMNINCWNEWTEGSYLEPDTVHGTKYLEAVRDVFKIDD